MKSNTLSIIAIVVSVLAIGFALLRVTPFEITNDVYVGIVASCVGISVALVIGFQIVNTLEIRKDISEQRQTAIKLETLNEALKDTISKQQAEMQEGFDIIMAIQQYNDDKYTNAFIAFEHMHTALVSSLKFKRDNYDFIFHLIRKYIANIDVYNFSQGGGYILADNSYMCDSNIDGERRNIKDIVDERTKSIKEMESHLRADSNFNALGIEYERVIKLFWKRIKDVKDDPTKYLSPDEKFAIMYPEQYIEGQLKRQGAAQ